MTDSATALVYTAKALAVGDPEIFIVERDGGWNPKEFAYYSIPDMGPDLGGELITKGWRPTGAWEEFESGAWSVDVEKVTR